MTDETQVKAKRKLGARDGLFQRRGWWWIDFHDADGRRHRKKAAPDYQTAKIIYRDTMTAIAKGEVLGVREEGLRLKDFVERRYWPACGPRLHHCGLSGAERCSMGCSFRVSGT